MPGNGVNYAEQAGFFDVRAFGDLVTLIGAGGIGGSLIPVLATMGVPELDIWDPDQVDGDQGGGSRNAASTLMIGPGDAGLFKVDVAAREATRLGVRHVTVHREPFVGAEHRDRLGTIVISGVDSMCVRKQIWREAFNPLNTKVRLYIDCRTGGSSFTVCVIDPLNSEVVEWYERFQLFDDPPVVAPRCGEPVTVDNRRNITFAPVACAAAVSGVLGRFSRGEPLPKAVMGDFNSFDLEKVFA